ncbi:MAG: hypothetical protein Q9222_007902, partial [Ikaeria aurantiellina]
LHPSAASSSSAAAPSSSSYLFHIGYWQTGSSRSASTFHTTIQWAIFVSDAPDGVTDIENFRPCEDTPAYIDGSPKDGDYPGYPVSKGPFDGGGREDCLYKRAEGDFEPGDRLDPGNLVCGGAKAKCVDDSSVLKICPLREGESDDDARGWNAVVLCSFEMELCQGIC